MLCDYQGVVTPREIVEALAETQCRHCGESADSLSKIGKKLAVCGEEYLSQLGREKRVLTPIPLCPDCHRDYHLDANGNHQDCQLIARQSREMPWQSEPTPQPAGPPE